MLQKTIKICRAAEIRNMQSDIIQGETDIYIINKQNAVGTGVSLSGGTSNLAKPK